MFSHDVTAPILVSQNNETAAMLVSQTSPLRVELSQQICIDAGHVSEKSLICIRVESMTSPIVITWVKMHSSI